MVEFQQQSQIGMELILTGRMKFLIVRLVQNHHLSASGGSEKAKYYVSGNFFDQGGIVEKTDFKRYSLRANINVDVSDDFRFGVNLAPSYTDSDKQPAGSPYFARPPGIVYAALVHYPSIKPYNE